MSKSGVNATQYQIYPSQSLHDHLIFTLTDQTRESSVSVSEECIQRYNELKLNKKHKFIIFKLSDDFTTIEVEDVSDDKSWDLFRQKLIDARCISKTGKVGKSPRYAVYDFHYELPGGEGTRSKITFISWSPDDAAIQSKMIYASSKDALKRSLDGIASDLQLNQEDDIEYSSIITNISKGLA